MTGGLLQTLASYRPRPARSPSPALPSPIIHPLPKLLESHAPRLYFCGCWAFESVVAEVLVPLLAVLVPLVAVVAVAELAAGRGAPEVALALGAPPPPSELDAFDCCCCDAEALPLPELAVAVAPLPGAVRGLESSLDDSELLLAVVRLSGWSRVPLVAFGRRRVGSGASASRSSSELSERRSGARKCLHPRAKRPIYLY